MSLRQRAVKESAHDVFGIDYDEVRLMSNGLEEDLHNLIIVCAILGVRPALEEAGVVDEEVRSRGPVSKCYYITAWVH